MPLKTVATKDEVPEAQRASAIETKDGQFVYEEAPDPALGDTGKAALDRMKQEKKDALAAMKAAEQKAADLEQKLAVAEGRVSDDGLKAIRKEFEEREAKIKADADAAKAQLRSRDRAAKIEEYWIPAGGFAARKAKMLKDLEGRVDLNEAGDDLVVLKDGKPSAVSAKDFFEKDYKKESPFFYVGSNGSGSGGEGGDASQATGKFDPVKAGKAAAAAHKNDGAGRELALK